MIASSFHSEHYLDLYADVEPIASGEKRSSRVSTDELFERLYEHNSVNERIVCVEEYTEPCTAGLIRNWVAWPHFFIVMETKSWWWSFERRNGVLVLQRATNFSNVQNRCRGRYRHRRWPLEMGPTCCRSMECKRGPKIKDIATRLLDVGLLGFNVEKSSSLQLTALVFEMCRSKTLGEPLADAPT